MGIFQLSGPEIDIRDLDWAYGALITITRGPTWLHQVGMPVRQEDS